MRIERGAAGHRPRFEDTIQLEPQIVMQARGGMLLDDKATMLRTDYFALTTRLRGFLEVTLGAVFSEFRWRHGRHLRPVGDLFKLPNQLNQWKEDGFRRARKCVPDA